MIEVSSAVDVLLPVASVSTEQLMGAARVQLSPDKAARLVVLMDEHLACAKGEAEGSILTIRNDDLTPSAWYPSSSLPDDASSALDEAISGGIDDASEVLVPEESLAIPASPAADYPAGGVDGLGFIRAIDLHTDGEGVWWTAIASDGDEEDERIQTGILPKSALQ
jgi:hypothetical protein